MKAASYFLERANEAIDAADSAGSEEASAAFFKEAETWLFMANQVLTPDSELSPPQPLPAAPRVARERRSFGRED
jgi:hypothetical protein